MLARLQCKVYRGRSNNIQARNKEDAQGVEATFRRIKRAVNRNEIASILSEMSPGLFHLLNGARAFGLDPDSVNTNTVTQFEVTVGFLARLQLGEEQLKHSGSNDLARWAIKSGILDVGVFSEAELDNIRVINDKAIGYLSLSGMILTNAPLYFKQYNAKWKLLYDKSIQEAEKTFEEVRSRQHLSKYELAVIIIESVYGQNVLSLRSYLVPQSTRNIIASISNGAPSEVYDKVIGEISEGRQAVAEDILDYYLFVHTNDQRLAFARAVCSRSRFNIGQATHYFSFVEDIDYRSVEGRCARCVIAIDNNDHVDDNMGSLKIMAEQNRKDPFIYWIIGIMCRDYQRSTGSKKYSRDGAYAFKRALAMFTTGPVMIHHTYANILSEELSLHAQALSHRRVAVQLEQKAWTYQGLGNTLTRMGQYDEANEAYSKMVALATNNANYWASWGDSLCQQKKWDECIEKCNTALSIDPTDYHARNDMAYAYEQKGKYSDALEQYVETMHSNPTDTFAYDSAARVLMNLGMTNHAKTILLEKDKNISKKK